MADIIPIRHTVDAMLLYLRRRYLEQQIGKPFDLAVSLELDGVIEEQEQLLTDPDRRVTRGKGVGR